MTLASATERAPDERAISAEPQRLLALTVEEAFARMLRTPSRHDALCRLEVAEVFARMRR